VGSAAADGDGHYVLGHTHLQGGFSQKEHDWHEIKPQFRTKNEAESWTMAIPVGTRHLINPGAVGSRGIVLAGGVCDL